MAVKISELELVDELYDGCCFPIVQNGETKRATYLVLKTMLLNSIYPIGAIYMSLNDRDPSEILGGIWERIEDRFLLAAGSTFQAGSTGGEINHTLTVDELPAHYHGYSTNIQHSDGPEVPLSESLTCGIQVGGRRRYHDKSDDTGSNQAHNNMPPYLTVYMWKRIM